jgi:hypothetical protein
LPATATVRRSRAGPSGALAHRNLERLSGGAAKAAAGTRTLDLLHGKQTVIVSLLPLYPCISATSPPLDARRSVSGFALFAGVLAPNRHRDAAVSRRRQPLVRCCVHGYQRRPGGRARVGYRESRAGWTCRSDTGASAATCDSACRRGAPNQASCLGQWRRAAGAAGCRPLASARRRRRARGVAALARL